MDRTLRWMEENLSGSYNAKYPPEHAKSGEHCTNSGTCLLICCYINILGKILLKGQSGDQKRFYEFVRLCMPDFIQESSGKPFPQTRGCRTGQDWLYKVFRCGFVHQFYPSETDGWSRFPECQEYWKEVGPTRVVLNVNGLKRGFDRGVQKFREIVLQTPELREKFHEYILK